MRNRFPSSHLARGVAAALLVLGTAARSPAQEEYVIGGGDVLQVNVWKNTELSQTVTVRPDGRITLPLVRDVVASGLTAVDLANVVAERLSSFVNAPNVTITVSAANSYRVYTQGAVAAGMHVLPSPLTARQLLSRAGGADAAADLARAYVLRREVEIPVDLTTSPGGGAGAAEGIALVAGDVLVVPFREASTARVLVAGEVGAPQSIPHEPGLTLLDAYLRAGGGTPAADLKGVRVARGRDGTVPGEIEVNLQELLTRGDLGRNIALAPGDVVVVPRLPERERVLVAGEVRTPVSLEYRDGLTVLDAFVAAGGGTDYADLDSAKVVRAGTDGKREELGVDLDRILKRGDLGRNIGLLPGDVVVVPR